MFSSAFGAYQSDCPVLKIDVSIHVASPMIVYENHDPTKRIFTSTTKSSNVKPPYFCAATITSFRIAVAYSSSIHVNCSAQPIATLSLQLLLVFIIVSEFRPISRGRENICRWKDIATASIDHEGSSTSWSDHKQSVAQVVNYWIRSKLWWGSEPDSYSLCGPYLT